MNSIRVYPLKIQVLQSEQFFFKFIFIMIESNREVLKHFKWVSIFDNNSWQSNISKILVMKRNKYVILIRTQDIYHNSPNYRTYQQYRVKSLDSNNNIIYIPENDIMNRCNLFRQQNQRKSDIRVNKYEKGRKTSQSVSKK